MTAHIFIAEHATISHYDRHDEASRAPDPDLGMERLKAIFPLGTADIYNVAVFSTSGHGSYRTIEDISGFIERQDTGFLTADDLELGSGGDLLTVTIYHPRLCSLRIGQVRVTAEDVPWLKRLRKSSHGVLASIGMPHVEVNECASRRPETAALREHIVDLMMTLSNDERKEVFSPFCTACGDHDPDGRCTCMRDE